MAKKTTNKIRPIRSMARFVIAMRLNYRFRIQNDTRLQSFVREHLLKLPETLSREDVRTLASQAAYDEDAVGEGDEHDYLRENDIANFELSKSNLDPKKIYWILRGLLFSDEEAKEIMKDGSLAGDQVLGLVENPHIFHIGQLFAASANFGPSVFQKTATVNSAHRTSWVTCARADFPGYRDEEIVFAVDTSQTVIPPPDIDKEANKLEASWEKMRMGGGRPPHNGVTAALQQYRQDSTNHTPGEERNILLLDLVRSKYSYNVTAKNSLVGETRKWRSLIEASEKEELEPVDYLASGIGIASCLFCEDDQKIVVGQRSNLEAFRSGEFDVAMVEGIRPDMNVSSQVNNISYVDVQKAMTRGYEEELGADLCEVKFGKSLAEVTNFRSIFEFGCDLEFYQWNFMAAISVNLKFSEIEELWRDSKHRRENQRLETIDANIDAVRSFVLENKVWSCGAACLLKSVELMELRKIKARR